MGFVSEQKAEAVPSAATESVEIGAEKETPEPRAEIDAYSTPAERGGQPSMFESRRQQEESSEEVIHNNLIRE